MAFHVDFSGVRWPDGVRLVGTAVRFQPPDGMAMDAHFAVCRSPAAASEVVTATVYVSSCAGDKGPDEIIRDIGDDLRRRLE